MKAIIYTDGASRGNPGDAGIGAVIECGTLTFEISEYIGRATNNVAEYKALIAALKKAKDLKTSDGIDVTEIEIKMDSELIERQIKGIYKVKMPHLQILYKEVIELLTYFNSFKVSHISRVYNTRADALATKAAKKTRLSRIKDNLKLHS
jgi:ribonuclease HI